MMSNGSEWSLRLNILLLSAIALHVRVWINMSVSELIEFQF